MYKYAFDEPERAHRPGLIAQDVLPVVPEVVDVMADDTRTHSIRYTDMVPFLIAAVKELDAKVEFSRCKCNHEKQP